MLDLLAFHRHLLHNSCPIPDDEQPLVSNVPPGPRPPPRASKLAMAAMSVLVEEEGTTPPR
jgi:hypothetical protein